MMRVIPDFLDGKLISPKVTVIVVICDMVDDELIVLALEINHCKEIFK